MIRTLLVGATVLLLAGSSLFFLPSCGCPDYCGDVCAGKPAPDVPYGCPTPACVCSAPDAGSDSGQ